MFKKKIKKDQGVLLADQNDEKTDKNGKQEKEQGSNERQIQQVVIKDSSQSINKGIQNNLLQQKQKQIRNNVSQTGDKSSGMKRSKNQDSLYVQDKHLDLENQPKKIQKYSFYPQKHINGISGNTMSKNEEKSKQVHEAFSDIAYHAGDNLIKNMNLQEDELEEEVAKRKFMQNVQTTKMIKEGKMNTKIYRGMNAYANHKMGQNDIKNAEQEYKKKMGPSRLNSTIKNTCRFDYVQNLCKDWHDSGYCPFGNSCLYLHDRSNVKTGWELEKEFQQSQRQRWKRINNPDIAKKQDRQKLLKTIQKHKPPQICSFCENPYKKPVQVQCSHIFCTQCAIKMLKCKSCNKRLSGIMNSAEDKLEKMSKNYQNLLLKLQTEQEEINQKRRKFENVNNLDIFAD